MEKCKKEIHFHFLSAINSKIHFLHNLHCASNISRFNQIRQENFYINYMSIFTKFSLPTWLHKQNYTLNKHNNATSGQEVIIHHTLECNTALYRIDTWRQTYINVYITKIQQKKNPIQRPSPVTKMLQFPMKLNFAVNIKFVPFI